MSIALKFNGTLVTGISKIDTITKTTVNLVNTVPFSDTVPPSVPTGLSYSSGVYDWNGDSMNDTGWRWLPSTDNIAVTLYELVLIKDSVAIDTIWRDPVINSSGGYIYWIFNSSYYGGAGYYCVKVRARDASGNWSAYTATDCITVGDSTPPTAPTTVSANLSGGIVLVTWSGATDNVGIDSYEVWHSTDAVTYSLLDFVFSEAYIDDFYSSGWNYYKIKTVDTFGNKSPFSSVASIFM